jgi:hypothetical protein
MTTASRLPCGLRSLRSSTSWVTGWGSPKPALITTLAP